MKIRIIFITLLLFGCSDAAKKTNSKSQLPPPEFFVAQPGDGIVKIAWGPVNDAQSYSLFWANTEGVNSNSTRISSSGTKEDFANTLYYVHGQLENNQTYYYRIASADSNDLIGELSSSINAMPLPRPDPVCDVAAPVVGELSIELSWPQDNALTYYLYFSSLNNPGQDDFTKHPEPITSPFVHHVTKSGIRYYYLITAENTSGESQYCIENIVSGIALAPTGIPNTPVGLKAEEGRNNVVISWPDVGKAETYALYSSSNPFVNIVPENRVPDLISNVTSPYTHSGLTGNNFYYYVLVANNSIGASVPSSPIEVALWHYAEPTEYISFNTSVSNYRLAMSENGTAAYVWIQSDGATDQVYVSQYLNGSWTSPIDENDHLSVAGRHSKWPNIKMDSKGNILVNWVQPDGTSDQLYKAEYNNGAWTKPSSLTQDAGNRLSIPGANGIDTFSVLSAMNKKGDAVVIWRQSDGTNIKLLKAEYRGGNWSVPTSIAADGIGFSSNVRYNYLDINELGQMVIVWNQLADARQKVFAAIYDGQNWTLPDNSVLDAINPDFSGFIRVSSVTMDDSGNAFFTWLEFINSVSKVYLAEYKNDVWIVPTTSAEFINFANGHASNPIVRLNDNGDKGMLMWEENNAFGSHLYASTYANGIWTHPSDAFADKITLGIGGLETWDLSFNNNGNAIVVWSQYNTTINKNQVYKAEFENNQWIIPSSIDDYFGFADSDAYITFTKMSDKGNRIILWNQLIGVNDRLYKAEFLKY